MTLGSQLVEAPEGGTVELTCSSDEEIVSCIFTTPGNTQLDGRAPGATYADGRIGVLEKKRDSCGLKIKGEEQEDFGAWK